MLIVTELMFSNWAPSVAVKLDISVTWDAAIVLLVSVWEPLIVTISPALVPPTVTPSNWFNSATVAETAVVPGSLVNIGIWPVIFGNVYVLSEPATTDTRVASLPSAAVPSNCTPFDVDTVTTLFTVCVPVTV